MHSRLVSTGKELIQTGTKAINGNNQSNSTGSNQKLNLKMWQWAVLIGVPSATVLSYVLYKKYLSGKYDTAKKRDEEKKDTKTGAASLKETSKTDTNKSANLKPNQKPKTQLEMAVDKKNQGNEFFQGGKFKEAIECYTEAIEMCAKTDKEELPKFYQNRAAAYENLKMYDKVVEDCTKALSIDQNYEKALARRAKAYENLQKLEEAFEDLTSLCILQKFSNSSMVAADKVVKKIGEKMSTEIFKKRNGLPISQHFVNNFFVGLNNDIIFRNEEFYEQAKNSESSLMKLAIDEFNDGDYDKCIGTCTKEIDENRPHILEAKNLRGSLYMLKCQYNEAIEDFNSILKDANASNRLKSNTYIKLTALNLQNNQEIEAFDNYEKAADLDPTNEDIYCNRAQVFAMKGKFDESFRDFDKCLEINGKHKIAKLQKAFFQFRQFYAQLSMFAQATQSSPSFLQENRELKAETAKLEALLGEFSDVPEAYSLYAQILSEQENYQKAEDYYKQALDKDSKNAALIVQRALNTMSWKNEFEDAVNMLEEAIKIDETCEFAYETLATIEIQRGNLPRAVELFEKAIQLTRNEESMTNLCSMLVGAKTQFKVLNHLRQNPTSNLEILNTIAKNNGFL